MRIVGYSFCHNGCNIYDLESKDPIYSFNLIVDALHRYLDNDAYDGLMHTICRTICAKIMGISIDEYICRFLMILSMPMITETSSIMMKMMVSK